MRPAAVIRAIPALPVILLSVPVCAAPVAEATEKRTVSNPVGAEQLASITLGLLLVLGLIFALAWLYRRYGNFATFNRADIQIIGGVSLGTREKAVLLEVDGTRLLVGVATGHVSTLHVFADAGKMSAADPEDDAFARQLEQSLSQNEEKNLSREASHGR